MHIKKDKASVLGETIRRVKELKKAAAEVEAACHSSGRECGVPDGDDRLSVEQCEIGGGLLGTKAMLSCEDRAGLMAEVAMAVRSVKGKALRAETVSVGGRTKVLVWVKGLGANKNEDLVVLMRRAFKVVMDRPRSCGNILYNRNLRFLQTDL